MTSRWTTKAAYRTKSKYNNKSQVFNGRKYHSIREATHAEELEWRVKAGEIEKVIPQFKLDLRVNGMHICNYYIDFKVILTNGDVEYHEVKGFETDVWRLKWLLTEALAKEMLEPDAKLLVIK